jgi:acyl-CoA synthetase (NDP forming)
VPKVLEDCIAVKARNVHICSSGFGETGEQRRKELESTIRDIALRGGLRIIGPNAMGLHVPSSGLRMFEYVPLLDGPVAFISQSGTLAMEYLQCAPTFGFGFSKVISFGNALVLDSTDFIEYFMTDKDTRIVSMYLEGVKDGKRLTKLVRELGAQKPVIIWKAGLTSPGARAAASHTGSLAGQSQIWSAFFKQTGAIKADSIEEMSEVAMTLLNLKPSPRMNVALLVPGGGPTVASGDICANEGLDCPALSADTQVRLKEFISSVNQGLSNPMDVPGVVSQPSLLKRTLEVLAADSLIDIIILHMPSNAFTKWPAAWAKEFKECVLRFNRENPAGKPLVIALQDDAHLGDQEKSVQELRRSGITAYSSLRSACRALNRFARYYESKAKGQ